MPSPLDSAQRIVVFIVNSLSSPPTNWDESESAAGHRGHPAQVDRHADRRLFVRSGRAAEGHGGALANDAPDPQFGRLCGQQGPGGRRRAARAGRRDLCDRRVVRRAEGQGGTRLPESAADVRSCCPPRPSIACAPRRGRSSWIRPSSSACSRMWAPGSSRDHRLPRLRRQHTKAGCARRPAIEDIGNGLGCLSLIAIVSYCASVHAHVAKAR